MIRECANNPQCSPGEMNAPPQHHPDSPTPPRHHPDKARAGQGSGGAGDGVDGGDLKGWERKEGWGGGGGEREIVLVSLGKRCGQVGVGWRWWMMGRQSILTASKWEMLAAVSWSQKNRFSKQRMLSFSWAMVAFLVWIYGLVVFRLWKLKAKYFRLFFPIILYYWLLSTIYYQHLLLSISPIFAVHWYPLLFTICYYPLLFIFIYYYPYYFNIRYYSLLLQYTFKLWCSCIFLWTKASNGNVNPLTWLFWLAFY